MSPNDLFLWILNSGGGATVASFIWERIPWYQKQNGENKRWLFFLSVLVVTLLGYLGLTYIPKDVIDVIAPYFGLVYATFTSYFVGTGFHLADKNSNS
jgi:hypothetical protein